LPLNHGKKIQTNSPPNKPKINQNLPPNQVKISPNQWPSKQTKIVNFGLETNHLATLYPAGTEKKLGQSRPRFSLLTEKKQKTADLIKIRESAQSTRVGWHQGDRISLPKNGPKCCPNPFLSK
jgi:hypothetical protein